MEFIQNEAKKGIHGNSTLTFSILDEKSSDFLQNLVLVEFSSKTRSLVDILISLFLGGTFEKFGKFSNFRMFLQGIG